MKPKCTTMPIVALGFLLMLTAFICPAQPSLTWTTVSPMNDARSYFSAVAYKEKIYVFGGGVVPAVSLNTVEEYDPVSDRWTRKAPMPQAMCCMATATLNDTIYVIGGMSTFASGPALATVYAYDPAHDTWTQKKNLAQARGYLTAAALEDKIFAIGGAISFGQNPAFVSVEVYNPATNQWVAGPPLTNPRMMPAALTVDDKIYVSGGVTGSPYVGLASTEVLHTSTGAQWTYLAGDMIDARAGHAAGVINGDLYVATGASLPLLHTSTERYDWASAMWKPSVAMAAHRRAVAYATVDNKMYVMGGNTEIAGTTVVVNWVERLEEVVVGTSEAGPDNAGSILQNTPNPVVNQTTIAYEVAFPGYFEIDVYDATGRLRLTPVRGYHTPGNYAASLDASTLESGVYVYLLRTDSGNSRLKKLVVIH